jgi:hypothetical protein
MGNNSGREFGKLRAALGVFVRPALQLSPQMPPIRPSL